MLERLIEARELDELYRVKKLKIKFDFPSNSYLILRSSINAQRSALVRWQEGWCRPVKTDLELHGLRPRDAAQSSFVDALLSPEVPLNIAIGSAGTGKTTIAMAYALEMWKDCRRRIVLCKPAVSVGQGRFFGPVPGDVSDKYAPFLESYLLVLSRLHGDRIFIEQMVDRGDLSYSPIEFMRGNEYEGTTLVLDEAQNLTWHELKTMVSRIGGDSKLVLLADPRQSDIETESGLSTMLSSSSFAASTLSSSIRLEKQYRSPIAQLIADIDDEYQGDCRHDL